MEGKNTCLHKCNGEKIEKEKYKCSLHESAFSKEQISIIWDFYVVKSIASQSGQSRSLTDYGWNLSQSKTEGLPALEQKLLNIAEVESFCAIRCKKITDSLKAMDLYQDRICIDHPRMVLMRNFSVDCDENENIKIESKENKISCLFRHIRNALAHGLTYFFENGNILLEDKDNKNITASILISQKTLLDWIPIVDKQEKFYKIHNTASKL